MRYTFFVERGRPFIVSRVKSVFVSPRGYYLTVDSKSGSCIESSFLRDLLNYDFLIFDDLGMRVRRSFDRSDIIFNCDRKNPSSLFRGLPGKGDWSVRGIGYGDEAFVLDYTCGEFSIIPDNEFELFDKIFSANGVIISESDVFNVQISLEKFDTALIKYLFGKRFLSFKYCKNSGIRCMISNSGICLDEYLPLVPVVDKIEYSNSSGINLSSCGNHVISIEGPGSNINVNGINFEYIKE